MPMDLVMKTYINFKFKKAKISMDIQKLKILKGWKYTQGPIGIIFQLKIIELEKELFVMHLERGMICRIPETLD